MKKNILAIIYPHITQMLVDQEDGFRYTFGTGKKLKFKCPNCGYIKEFLPSQIIRSGFSCPKCSDSISIPERFMSNFLESNNIDFKHDVTTKWSNKKRYDFIISNNIIIETHGLQHYEENRNGKFTTFKNQIEIDQYKKELSLNNGIQHYIELDCRLSTLEYIKNSILNSEIPELLNLNLNNFNWENCFEKCLKSMVFKVCELYNQNLTFNEIRKKLKIGKRMVRESLEKGTELKICNYTPELNYQRASLLTKEKRSRKIICINDKQTYDTITEAGKYYKIPSYDIIKVCQKLNIFINSNLNGEKTKLIFRYLEEYDPNEIFHIPSIRKIKCTTTGKIFNTSKEAGLFYNIKPHNLLKCCRGERKSAGKLNDQKLSWVYI